MSDSPKLYLTEPTQRRSIRSPIESPNEPPAPPPTRTSTTSPMTYTSFPSPKRMKMTHPGTGIDQRDGEIILDETNVTKKPPSSAAVPSGRKSLFVTFLTFLASAPALLGMCCWPSLIAAFVGGAVTGSARELSHTVSFIVTAVVLTGLIVYTAYCTRLRAQLNKTRTQIYGPFLLLCFASLLVLADPTRHVLQDAGVWDDQSSNAFYDGCGEGWNCLTTTGILFMCVFTYLGFILLFTANFWNANIIQKVKMFVREWKSIKAQHQALKLQEFETKRLAASNFEQLSGASVVGENPRPVIRFDSLHFTMKPPPTIYYKKEETNKIGYRMPQSQPTINTTSGLPANFDASIKRPGEYKAEGYSFEVDSPNLTESVIKVSPNRSNGTVPGASSPTVTSTPTSTSPQRSGTMNFSSPLSVIMLTPPHACDQRKGDRECKGQAMEDSSFEKKQIYSDEPRSLELESVV